MLKRTILSLGCALALLWALPAAAATPNKDNAKAAGSPAEPKVFVTRHTGRFGGTQIKYTARAGETFLKDDAGKPIASIFSVTYTRDGVRDVSRRPVTFVFNGGPGSASLWLHMGLFGPKRVVLPSDAKDDGAPPYPIADNPLSVLDVTDLVFIDPVGTGYSIPLGDKKGKDFWGVGEDARSVARFIETWVRTNKRWNSPKYLAGESYGTFRAAAVTNELEGGYNDIALNGVILISTILDVTLTDSHPGNELIYMIYLPTYAATAWYHNKISGPKVELETLLAEARDFAMGDYALALLKGNALSSEERARIRARLAYFTGLSEDYLDKANLRVTPSRFQKELLRDEGKTVGRLDGRYTGTDFDNAGERPDNDPSFYAIDGAYMAAINQYFASDLKVDIDRRYQALGFKVNRSWNWKMPDHDRGFRLGINVAPYLGRAMRENADFRVLAAAGYYDFATPFFEAEYTFARNGFVPERVKIDYFEAGHMMYLHQPSIEKLATEIRAFITAGAK